MNLRVFKRRVKSWSKKNHPTSEDCKKAAEIFFAAGNKTIKLEPSGLKYWDGDLIQDERTHNG